MKYLLYYNLNSKFVTDQTAAGGDGTSVVSVVDGVAWTKDQEKTYYRYADNDAENLTSYTVTIHYYNETGEKVSVDDVISVDAYKNKKVTQIITPKVINGVSANEGTVKLSISGDTACTFTYNGVEGLESVPLSFQIISDGVICWKSNVGSQTYARTIQYKKNDGDWTDITSTSTGETISVVAGDTVQFRGDNGTYCYDINNYNFFCGTTASFNAYGNIMSLVNSTNFKTLKALTENNAFYKLFYCCDTLINACDLILPATALSESCYSDMFFHCTSLVTAPVLPSTNLTYSCYNRMFRECESLLEAPELPATVLANACYNQMFTSCTSLMKAPVLPARKTTSTCYYMMFYCCEHIDYIKCLATDLSGYMCLSNWVAGVASAGTFVPASSMVETWPNGSAGIPSSWVIGYSELYLTFGITSSGNLYWRSSYDNINSYGSIFYRKNEGSWMGITAQTGNGATISVSSGDTIEIYGTKDMYSGWPERQGVGAAWGYTFCGSTASFKLYGNIMSLTAQENFKDKKITHTDSNPDAGYSFAEYFFSNCTGLTDATNLVLPKNVKTHDYIGLFKGCSNLTGAPVLPATTLAWYCYEHMFENCTSLTTPPELPATTSPDYCYAYMFENCTSLTTPPELPATSLSDYCYAYMFMGCTNLTTAPVLPATSLKSSCYAYMFKSCTKLNYIKAMFTTEPSASYTRDWVSGVASSGTFVKNSSAGWNVSGVNGVPTGWTIETASN